MEGFGVFLPAFAVRSVPSLDRGRRPLRRFVGMAVVASIRRAEPCRLVGTWYAETVIVPPIDDHIGALRHVAGRAGERGARAFMAGRGGRAGAYCCAAWHCMETPSPGARNFAACGSWQSPQVTPAANILLCLNEP